MMAVDVTNALSVDVEGFVESNVQSFPIQDAFRDDRRERKEIETNTRALLEQLDRFGVRATFFFVGTVADRLPRVVRDVAALGHEVASHSYEHARIYGLDRNEFRDRLRASKECLEDLSGTPVYGFRAPDFSITRASTWALDILQELGFVYDSSIYPIGLHDVYGIRATDASIHMLQGGLIEFPLATAEILGRRIPFGGGGYFRLYPVALTRRLIARVNQLGEPCMFYIHPYEAGPVVPRIKQLSPYRRFRHYVNVGRGQERLASLLSSVRFAPAIEVLRQRKIVEV